MKVYKDMFFGISDEKLGTYGGKHRIFKPLPYKKYIHELKKQVIRNPEDFVNRPFKRYSYITGRVKKGILSSFDKYLLLLDSDGSNDRILATDWLNKRGIRHFSIQSSPNKYWIICDKIDTVDKHTYLMDEIPGIDTRYTDCSRKQGVLLYRGFPKPGFIPQFEDVSKFTGMGLYEKWILRFKEYWESEDIQKIANNLFAEAI